MTIYTELKADIAGFWNVPATDIADELLYRAVNWVKAEIDQLGFSLSTYTTNLWKSTYYQLYEAAFWFACELLSQAGIIAQRTGEISQETLGRLTLRYQTRQPIFFFFGKTMKTMDYERLLSHETFRTLAYSFVEMFHIDYLKGDIRKYPAQPQVNVDTTWDAGWGADT